jgi:hypothetical protein
MDELEYSFNLFDNTNIKEINYSNFNIKKNEVSIKNKKKINGVIICYSNLCISCKNHYNTFVNLSELFNNFLNFYSINCNNIKDKNDELIKPLNITEYPLIKIIKNNVVVNKDISIDSLDNLIFILNSYF